jgi:hypothetical protein
MSCTTHPSGDRSTVGGNAGSAYLSGNKVQRIQFAVFVISGIMVSLAAISITSRMMAASARTLTGLQIDSVAAVTVWWGQYFRWQRHNSRRPHRDPHPRRHRQRARGHRRDHRRPEHGEGGHHYRRRVDRVF